MGNNFEHALRFSDLFVLSGHRFVRPFLIFFVSFSSYLAEFSACWGHCTVRAVWRAVAARHNQHTGGQERRHDTGKYEPVANSNWSPTQYTGYSHSTPIGFFLLMGVFSSSACVIKFVKLFSYT